MEAQPDYRDLLALFNEFKVDYVIVGAHALAYHGIPRYTGDIDILVRPDLENAQRILSALNKFGLPQAVLRQAILLIQINSYNLGNAGAH